MNPALYSGAVLSITTDWGQGRRGERSSSSSFQAVTSCREAGLQKAGWGGELKEHSRYKKQGVGLEREENSLANEKTGSHA